LVINPDRISGRGETKGEKMKTAKFSIVILAALLALGVSTTAYAFHAGGVAECGGCHSMHSPAAGGSHLLVGVDPSSACLSCHEHAGDTGPSSYHVSTADADMPAGTGPKQRTPGGDFGWLKKTYTFVVRGTTNVEEGQTHGHNIVAADKGYVADTVNTTAPGGTFPAAALGCESCHDPHGKYRRIADGSVSNTGAPIIASGSYKTVNAPVTDPPAAGLALGVYRLLAGNGYTKGGATFTGVPAAKAPNTYNLTEATNQVRVAYGVKTGSGHVTWGNWCGTCHGEMHSSGNYVHPTDQGLGSTLDNYNAYKKSGDMTGVPASSYWSLVPFNTNSGDYAVLAGLANNNAPTYAGPVANDQVSCNSCHRAHATGFVEMLKWDMETTFVVQNGVYGAVSRGRTADEAKAAYYDRDPSVFATYQRVLCNKCHAQD
jgi:predicted CXXCH cytochrome family protein